MYVCMYVYYVNQREASINYRLLYDKRDLIRKNKTKVRKMWKNSCGMKPLISTLCPYTVDIQKFVL